MTGIPDLEQLGHLQEELTKVENERSRALQQLEEAKKMMLSQAEVIKDLVRNKDILNNLEAELESVKESERKMLESLIYQTKQLEQTKISLEESKLETKSLRQRMKITESSAFVNERSSGNYGRMDAVPAREEIEYLRNELKSAFEAEEKSKKAMDDLAMALKEVATESNQVKEKLSKTQIEFANAKFEEERSRISLKRTEEKLRATMDETKRLKFEAEESFSTWIEKENGFLNCVKMCEDEIASMKRENSRLIDNQRSSREEISKLRDIVKQAVSEATIVKEALEIARNENSTLKDILSDRDNAFQRIRQDYECLKVSEAAALDSVNELKRLLAATSSKGSSTTANSLESGLTNVNGIKISKPMSKFPSECWRADPPRIPKVRRYSLGEPAKFEDSIFEKFEGPMKKEQSFASVSDASGSKAQSSSVDSDDRSTVIFSEFEHEGIQSEQASSPSRQKKRRQIMRRFGDLLKRGFISNDHHT